LLGEADSQSERLIRLDLQMIKSIATPKNEIHLMKLTEELLRALEILCSNDKKYKDFEDQILNNNVRLEKKVDEVAYLFMIAREQINSL
jgi:hypothetical protein